MKLGLGINSKLEDGQWVDYDEDVKFCIRYSSPKFIRESRARHIKNKYRQGQKIEEMSKQAEKEWDADLWDHMIKDWKGIEIEGKPAVCNKENKKLLGDRSSDHANFVLDYSTSIGNYQEVEKVETELKN